MCSTPYISLSGMSVCDGVCSQGRKTLFSVAEGSGCFRIASDRKEVVCSGVPWFDLTVPKAGAVTILGF